MRWTDCRWELLLVLLFGVLSSAADAASDPFPGSWGLTLPDGRAGWLGVTKEGDGWAASLLWGEGNVLPVQDVQCDGKTLTFRQEVAAGDKTIVRQMTGACRGDDLTLTVVEIRDDGTEGAKSKCTGRRSPPLPPRPDLAKVRYEPAVRLIDEHSLKGWRLVEQNAPNGWTVKDGVLSNRVDPASPKRFGNLRTNREFQDFRLVAEVRTLAGSNSGIYLRGVYEIQIAESFGQPATSQTMGALYSRIAPSVSAEKPIGEWQRIDITLVNRHVTVVLNGVTLISNQPVQGCTGGALISDELSPGPVMLQGDHADIDFRNMFIYPVIP